MTTNNVNETQLDRLAAKRDILRRHWRNGGADGEQWTDTFPLTEEELRAIERDFGVVLPAEYRAFLARFGDTIVGPGNVFSTARDGLSPDAKLPFPLEKAFLGTCSPRAQQVPQDDQWEDYGRLMKEWNLIPLNHGVLRICDYGCAIYGVLILNGRFQGRIWMQSGDAAYYGPFGGFEIFHDEIAREWEPTNFPQEYWFLDWYENWLNAEVTEAERVASAPIPNT